LIVDFNFRVPDNASYAIRHIQRIQQLVGFDRVFALEIGNEPDDYRGNYRGGSYTYQDYKREVGEYIQQFYQQITNLPQPFFQAAAFAGGGWWSDAADLASTYLPYFTQFSVHSYPETHCNGHITTIQNLLSDRDSESTAKSYITSGLLQGLTDLKLPLVMGEGNTVSCHGEGGVSNTFAATLWSIDTLLNMVSVNVTQFFLHHGVEEDFNLTSYSAFVWRNIDQDIPTVMPIYYGIKFFGEASANYARIIQTDLQTNNEMIKVWALRSGETNDVRVVIIHKDLNATSPATVGISLSGGMSNNTGTALRLSSPSASSVFGIVYAGQTYDGTKDGRPVGTRVEERIQPVGGVWTVTVQPISAVLLTIPLTVKQQVNEEVREY